MKMNDSRPRHQLRFKLFLVDRLISRRSSAFLSKSPQKQGIYKHHNSSRLITELRQCALRNHDFHKVIREKFVNFPSGGVWASGVAA